jgi:HPt (histidine-containing phosphotransfer) domain-containing protein
LQKAVKENNSVMVRNSGHTLKGTAANLSLHNLSDVGLEIEDAGKGELTDRYDDLYSKLVQNVKEFQKFMLEK